MSIALRDQLIHNILVWRAVQRESLTRQGSKAGKIRVRTEAEKATASVRARREASAAAVNITSEFNQVTLTKSNENVQH